MTIFSQVDCALALVGCMLLTALSRPATRSVTGILAVYSEQGTNCSRTCQHAQQSSQKWWENSAIIRSTQNVDVGNRALEIFDDVCKFALHAKMPKLTSVDVIKAAAANPLSKVKSAAFVSIAKPLEGFLTAYQTPQPIIPMAPHVWWYHVQVLWKAVNKMFERISPLKYILELCRVSILLRYSTIVQLMKVTWVICIYSFTNLRELDPK